MKKNTNFSQSLRLYITGFSMGLADLIPGVSGGTIAFISGIYEELLQSIKFVSGPVLQTLLKGKIIEAVKMIPFGFLIPLMAGIFSAILLLARLLHFLLHTYPNHVWGFFFGLVLASTWIVLKRVTKWNSTYIVSFILAALGAYVLVGAVPVETPATMPLFFLSGMIAICAMILPGISGSFILVLLGKYEQVLGAVKDMNILLLAVFMIGAIVGLALFSRLLSYLFAKHHDISVAILAGFMAGSLRKLWPWKEVLITRINSQGEIVPVVERNFIPGMFDTTVLAIILLMGFAVSIMIFVDRLQLTKEHSEDIDLK